MTVSSMARRARSRPTPRGSRRRAPRHLAAAGESSVILLTPPCISVLKRLLNVQGVLLVANDSLAGGDRRRRGRARPPWRCTPRATGRRPPSRSPSPTRQRRDRHFCWRLLSIPIETPNKGRMGCSRMAVFSPAGPSLCGRLLSIPIEAPATCRGGCSSRMMTVSPAAARHRRRDQLVADGAGGGGHRLLALGGDSEPEPGVRLEGK